ncbi:MDR family MFS transporter [Phytohabitans rumicis]|uniref:MFS transporter n=1 Tax=Phytohabitans rumicis TaxID=1076125 RepID=A0A6V8LFE8_9ACTN|nr:MDR family MFS transporter [Phytohabitans rumicis]GFJ95963.1 MFS transporter [Phytohabitans rumicis]
MSVSKVAERERLDPAFIRLALVLITGVLAVVFDTTVVNVALDTLARDLHVGVATVQWVTTGYLLALGMAVPVTGWLIHRLGGKRVWLCALALFLAGSVGASLAWDAPSLVAWRVVQGIGGGLMLPVLTTLLVQAAGGRSLGRVTALVTFPALLGPIFGPLLGGLIVQHTSWRWIFWVNVPFCVVGLLLAWRLMPAFPGTGRSRGRQTPELGAERQARNLPAAATEASEASQPAESRLDAAGLALASPGIAAIVYALAQVGADGGFGHPTVLVPLLGGLALLVAFTVRSTSIGDRALVDLRLLRVTSFSAATGLLFLSGFALYGAMLLVPLYFQQVRGQDPFAAGLLIAAQGVGVLASRGIAGRLTDRIGARPVTSAGLVVVALATVPFALATAHTPEWWLVAALVVRGIGLGAVTIPVMASAYLGLDRAAVPHASIITRTAQQIGGSFGTAVLAVALERTTFDAAFWWSIGFTVAAVVLARWLPNRPAQPSAP